MLDKNALINDLKGMVERRKKEAAHLEFYMNPQKIMINDIIDLLNSGKYDVKNAAIDEVEDVKAPENPIRTYGCWNTDW